MGEEILKLNDEEIEVRTDNIVVERYMKQNLLNEKTAIEKRIIEIDRLLTKF